jgi:hypothetical protein
VGDEKPKRTVFRVTVEQYTEGENPDEKSTIMVQFTANHVDAQKRKGDCTRLFASSDSCASCLVIRRDMQKESTR